MSFDYKYIDLAIVNGNVITVNKSDEIAEAIGIKGNKIVFVGTNDELLQIISKQKLLTEEIKIIDARGKTVIPGIIDTHFHPILAGLIEPNFTGAIIDTFYPNCTSLEELLSIIKKAVSFKNPGEWISLMGYEPMHFPELRHPTLEELNNIAPENPVHCMHCGGHVCVYNSKALEYLNVFKPEDAYNFPLDEVEVKDGKLTGMVRGHTHFKLWGKVTYTQEQQEAAAMRSHEAALKNGITTIHDCGELGKVSYHTMQKLSESGKFKVRLYMMIHNIFGKDAAMAENDNFISLGLTSGLGNEHFKIGGSKFMIDGGSGAPSCATREPFTHDPGLPREKGWQREEVAQYIKFLNESDCQATAHAIGDLAVEFMVEGYEKIHKEHWKPNLRHRIEHCSLVDEDLIARIADLDIIPTVNSGMITTIGANYKKFYGERMKFMIALRSMLDKGIKVSIASDYPSGPIGIATIDGAVNRFDRVSHFQTDENQSISVMEAVRCATLHGAYAGREENVKGSIEISKLADLVILSCNILDIPRKKINEVEVETTIIDGRIEYNKN